MSLTETELKQIFDEAAKAYSPNTAYSYKENYIAGYIAAVIAERERANVLVQMIEKTLQQYFEKYMPKKVNTSDEQQLGMYTAYWFLKDTLNQYNQ